MVSIRCRMVVKMLLEKTGLDYKTVNLGEVELVKQISASKRELLKTALLK